MIHFAYIKRRPPRIIISLTIILSMIFQKMILDDTSTIKAFTDDTNTVDVEYLINKELRIINIWLKQHTYALNAFYCIM